MKRALIIFCYVVVFWLALPLLLWRIARSLDRLLISEWLLASGRKAEAYAWLSSVPEDRGDDVILLARVAALKLINRILEKRLGKHVRAVDIGAPTDK